MDKNKTPSFEEMFAALPQFGEWFLYRGSINPPYTGTWKTNQGAKTICIRGNGKTPYEALFNLLEEIKKA